MQTMKGPILKCMPALSQCKIILSVSRDRRKAEWRDLNPIECMEFVCKKADMAYGRSSEIKWLKECLMTGAALPMGSFTLSYATMKNSSVGCREKDRGKINIFALSKLCGEAVACKSGLSPLIYVSRP